MKKTIILGLTIGSFLSAFAATDSEEIKYTKNAYLQRAKELGQYAQRTDLNDDFNNLIKDYTTCMQTAFEEESSLEKIDMLRDDRAELLLLEFDFLKILYLKKAISPEDGKKILPNLCPNLCIITSEEFMVSCLIKSIKETIKRFLPLALETPAK